MRIQGQGSTSGTLLSKVTDDTACSPSCTFSNMCIAVPKDRVHEDARSKSLPRQNLHADVQYELFIASDPKCTLRHPARMMPTWLSGQGWFFERRQGRSCFPLLSVVPVLRCLSCCYDWYRTLPRCILERCGASIAPRAGGVFVQSILNGSPAESREFAPWDTQEILDQSVREKPQDARYCFLMEMDGQPIRQLSRPTAHPLQ